MADKFQLMVKSVVGKPFEKTFMCDIPTPCSTLLEAIRDFSENCSAFGFETGDQFGAGVYLTEVTVDGNTLKKEHNKCWDVLVIVNGDVTPVALDHYKVGNNDQIVLLYDFLQPFVIPDKFQLMVMSVVGKPFEKTFVCDIPTSCSTLLEAIGDFSDNCSAFRFKTGDQFGAGVYLTEVTVDGKTLKKRDNKCWAVLVNVNGDVTPVVLDRYKVGNNDQIVLLYDFLKPIPITDKFQLMVKSVVGKPFEKTFVCDIPTPCSTLLEAIRDFSENCSAFGFETGDQFGAGVYLSEVTVDGNTLKKKDNTCWDVLVDVNGDVTPVVLDRYKVSNNDQIILQYNFLKPIPIPDKFQLMVKSVVGKPFEKTFMCDIPTSCSTLLEAIRYFADNCSAFRFETGDQFGAGVYLSEVTVDGKTLKKKDNTCWDVLVIVNGDATPVVLDRYQVRNNDQIALLYRFRQIITITVNFKLIIMSDHEPTIPERTFNITSSTCTLLDAMKEFSYNSSAFRFETGDQFGAGVYLTEVTVDGNTLNKKINRFWAVLVDVNDYLTPVGLDHYKVRNNDQIYLLYTTR